MYVNPSTVLAKIKTSHVSTVLANLTYYVNSSTVKKKKTLVSIHSHIKTSHDELKPQVVH